MRYVPSASASVQQPSPEPERIMKQARLNFAAPRPHGKPESRACEPDDAAGSA
jgi:hypothetical protein